MSIEIPKYLREFAEVLYEQSNAEKSRGSWVGHISELLGIKDK